MSFPEPIFPYLPCFLQQAYPTHMFKTEAECLELLKQEISSAHSTQEALERLHKLEQDYSFSTLRYSLLNICKEMAEAHHVYGGYTIDGIREKHPQLLREIIFHIGKLSLQEKKLDIWNLETIGTLLQDPQRFDALLAIYGKQQTDAFSISRFLESPLITNKKTVFDILKHHAEHLPNMPGYLLQHLEKLLPEQIVEISMVFLYKAKGQAESRPYDISCFFENVRKHLANGPIILQKIALEIAKQGKVSDFPYLTTDLASFCFSQISENEEEETARILFAKQCSLVNLYNVITHFEKFLIMDGGKTLYEIIHDNINQMNNKLWDIVLNKVECLYITNPIFSHKLAALYSSSPGVAWDEHLIDHIQKLISPDPELAPLREEIAVSLAEKAPFLIAKNIQAFYLDQRSPTLFEIAKICTRLGHVEEVMKNKSLFGLIEEEKRIELAQIGILGSAEFVIKNINIFQITSKNALFELAKMSANRGYVLEVINTRLSFGLIEEEKKIKIGQILAQFGRRFLEALPLLGIINQDALQDILKNCYLRSERDFEALLDMVCAIPTLRLNPSHTAQLAIFLAGQDGLTYGYRKQLLVSDPLFLMLLSLRSMTAIRRRAQSCTFLDSLPNISLPLLPANIEEWLIEKNKKIQSIENPQIKKHLHDWLITVGCEFLYSTVAKKPLLPLEILDAILEYRNPEERFRLLGLLSTIFLDEKKYHSFCNTYDYLFKEKKLSKTWLLPYITLVEGMGDKPLFIENSKQLFIDCPKWTDVAKDMPNFLELLYELVDNPELDLDKKWQILQNLTAPLKEKIGSASLSKNPNQPTQNTAGKFRKVSEQSQFIACLLKSHLTNLIENVSDFSVIVEQIFSHFFGIEHFSMQNYQHIFGKFRAPHAIFSYYSDLASLEEPQLLSLFKQCVKDVIDSKFQDTRYAMEGRPHLKKVFENRPSLLQKWKVMPPPISIESAMSPIQGSASHGFNFVEFFGDILVTNKHLSPERIPFLMDYLLGNITRENALQIIEQERKTKSIPTELIFLSIQEYCLRLCEENISASDAIKIIKQLKNACKEPTVARECNELINDIERPVAFYEPKNSQELTVSFSDNFEDLLLCGTEVVGSCQRINGTPSKNKCLLAYIMDGKNQIVVIKNSSGKIEMRAIIRILLDEQDNPVLFMDKIYGNADPSLERALKNTAAKRAQDLGLPFYDGENATPNQAPVTLKSLGSPAPYEYADHGGGVINGGAFSVTAAYLH